MISILVVIFIVGYLAVVFEHPLKLDKSPPALLMGGLMWTILSIGFYSGAMQVIDHHDHIFGLAGITDPIQKEFMEEGFKAVLLHHLGKISEILVFLIGAMTIVELIDLHKGFDPVKSLITTKNKRKLLIIVTIISFFLSAVIDNLTTTIIMISILRKLITEDRELRIWFVSMVVISANAGGVWSPVGDVTTTMIWIANKVTEISLVKYLFIPAVICVLVPLLFILHKKIFIGNIETSFINNEESSLNKLLSSKSMLYLGLGMIVFVPIFKTLTHLPPWIGMIIALAVVWIRSETIHPEENFSNERRVLYSGHKALSRIEISSILFFVGILLAVAVFESVVVEDVSMLKHYATSLNSALPNQNLVIILLGFVSAVIDNVPLVAAALGMYDFELDSLYWHFIAYTSGTGGSMLIIGSAAGVAAMGLEKIDFIWYLKKVSLIALAGYLSGALVFLLMN